MLLDAIKAIGNATENAITSVHTAMLGKIEEYNPADSTATVLPLATGYYYGELLDYPLLYKVPVVMPRTGDISITYPVEEGDVVLLIFCERNLNRWMGNNEKEIGAHRLTAAIALPGYAYGVTGHEADATANRKIVVANGSTSIEVRPDKVVINGDLKVNGSIS